MISDLPKVDIEKPRFSQDHFPGRFAHYCLLTNPLNLFLTDRQLERARAVVQAYRLDVEVPEITKMSQLWRAKYMYESAYHPETGRRLPLIVRMSAQIPMHVLLIGGMLAFHKTWQGVIFWQSLYQTWSTVVNFMHSSPTENIGIEEAVGSACVGTGTACLTALAMNVVLRNKRTLLARLVPVAAVTLASYTSLPLLHFDALLNGVVVYDEDKVPLAMSRNATALGLAETILSRLLIVAPAMVLTPLMARHLNRSHLMIKRLPMLTLPFEVILCTLLFLVSTPVGFATFNPHVRMDLEELEPEIQEAIKQKYGTVQSVWFRRSFSGVRSE